MPGVAHTRKSKSVPRRDKNNRDVMAPKPVRPHALRYHGLFGITNVKQHIIFDQRWTPDSLVEQYSNFAELLAHSMIYHRHEVKANRRNLLQESKRLRSQTIDGRIKLQKILVGNNSYRIRNFLNVHKDMQRLYQKMPIHLVVDNINQRTFVLRKERDRLQCRLDLRKREYRTLLLSRGELETHIRYENEFVLDEELRSRALLKRIENSNVRLKAVRTINTTYKQMVQVLLQDEIFYEPILRSLSTDMDDQANLIKHVLYLGMPVITKFKELNRDYRQLEYKSHENNLSKMEMLTTLTQVDRSVNIAQFKPRDEVAQTVDPKRYVRETRRMLMLKYQLKANERIIKSLKLASLCSQAKEIYPRVKELMHNNVQLSRSILNDLQTHTGLENKMQYSSMLCSLLINNLSDEEIGRLARIKELKQTLQESEKYAKSTFAYLKNRADVFVLLRINLWNLMEILRHIDKGPKTFRTVYPNSYLKLPLLKFEMLNMCAAPPEMYEEDIAMLLYKLKRILHKLVHHYNPLMRSYIDQCAEKYHFGFLETVHSITNAQTVDQAGDVHEDLIEEHKTNANVPNRKQIKGLSVKIIEEVTRRNEM